MVPQTATQATYPPRQTLLCPFALTSARNDGAADNQARTEHADDAHGLPKCQRGNNGGPEGLGGEQNGSVTCGHCLLPLGLNPAGGGANNHACPQDKCQVCGDGGGGPRGDLSSDSSARLQDALAG